MIRYLQITALSLAVFVASSAVALADPAATGAMTHAAKSDDHMATGSMSNGDHKPAATGGMTSGAMSSDHMATGAMAPDKHAAKKDKKSKKKAVTAGMSTDAMTSH